MMIQALSPALRSMAPQTVSRQNTFNQTTEGTDLFTRAPRFGMLVLSRKKNESIVINNDITLTVIEIRGDKVRLGIVAPKDVPVHRQEVWEAIQGQPQPPGTSSP